MQRSRLFESGNEPRPDIQGSRNRRSLFRLVFFKRFSFLGILISLTWVWLWADVGIAKVMKQTLALPDRDLDTEGVAYIGRQTGTIPHFEAEILRVGLYGGINGRTLLCRELWRSARTLL